MRFCERCGSYMERTTTGLVCPKCGNKVIQNIIEIRRAEKPSAEPVYVVENVGEGSLKVAQKCPKCGYGEAFRIVLTTQGEHAGVKQDRSVERFTCAKCHYTWTRS